MALEEINTLRTFQEFSPLSEERIEDYLRQPEIMPLLHHPETADALWRLSWVHKAISYYRYQQDVFEAEVTKDFASIHKISIDESPDEYGLSEEWEDMKVGRGIYEWRSRTNDLLQELDYEQRILQRQVGLKDGENLIGDYVKVWFDLEFYENGLDELWFNTTIQTPTLIQAVLRTYPYSSYLKTGHWRRVRAAMFLIHGCACQEEQHALSGDSWYSSGWDVDMHVHHLSYDNLGMERYKDIVLLCEKHHKEWHYNINEGGLQKIKLIF